MVSLIIIGCSSPPEPVVEEEAHDETANDLEPVIVRETKSDNGLDSNNVNKIFILTGQNFKFVMDGVDNPELRVSKGDKVRIEFTPSEGFHDWKVDEFSAATKKVKAGDSTVVEFAADQAGTFEYYCSVGSHRQQGMKGKLIVE